MKLAIVTSRDHARYHDDDRPLIDALERRGVACAPCVWDDAAVAWDAYHAALVRTPWDYYRRWPEFRVFLDRIEATGTPLFNPPKTLRWNADKRYLLELAAAGVPVVETRVVARGDVRGLRDAVASLAAEELVVKPVVSAGAWHTVRFARRAFDPDEPALATALAHADLLVQPYLDVVARDGEWSLMFLGGRYSHAILKRPRAGDFRVQEKHGGVSEPREPGDALVAAAQRAVDALPALGHAGCLYARVDGVVREGAFVLMELEAFEPQLFLTDRPDAGERFAEVVVAAMRAAGHRLAPMSGLLE